MSIQLRNICSDQGLAGLMLDVKRVGMIAIMMASPGQEEERIGNLALFKHIDKNLLSFRKIIDD